MFKRRKYYSGNSSYSSSKTYQRKRNWDAKNGVYRNGRGEIIRNTRAYFKAVAENRYGYNKEYRNGKGEKIRNVKAYFRAVAEDKYGYNS